MLQLIFVCACACVWAYILIILFFSRPLMLPSMPFGGQSVDGADNDGNAATEHADSDAGNIDNDYK